MRVLVTGSTGFVGRAVVARLLDVGHAVIAMSRGSAGDGPRGAVTAASGDLLDATRVAEVVAEHEPDAVIHLAALTRVRESFAEPIRYFQTNVHGTANLLAATTTQAERSGRPMPFVSASTAAVYRPLDRPLREDDPLAPVSPYAASKLAADQLVGFHAATGAIAAVTLRSFNVAGSIAGAVDRDGTRLIPKALAVAAGRVPHVTVNGDGSVRREYLHVADAADAFVAALTAARAGKQIVVNAGSGEAVPISAVLEVVEAVSGRRVNVVRGPAQPEPAVLSADLTRARAVLGWQPTRSRLDRVVADAWRALGDDAGGLTSAR